MAEGLPTVVLYKVKRFDLCVARWFIKAKYISLVNLLADAEVFPEYLTWRDASGELVRWAGTWLGDPEAYARTTSALTALQERVAQPGASDRAADHIVTWLSQYGEAITATVIADHTTAPYRGPHEHGNRQKLADGPGSHQR